MPAFGLFGGSFNPIHVAHLVLAERVREERALDKVFFIPAGRPPHKPCRPLAPAEHRLRMVELAIADNDAFAVLDMELVAKQPSYTLRTVRELKRRLGPGADLYLVLGADSVLDLPNWWRADELVREVAVIALDRPGHDLERRLDELAARFGTEWVARVRDLKVNAPLLEVSATEVRRRARAGLSIRYLVPEPVRAYIVEHGLYSPDTEEQEDAADRT